MFLDLRIRSCPAPREGRDKQPNSRDPKVSTGFLAGPLGMGAHGGAQHHPCGQRCLDHQGRGLDPSPLDRKGWFPPNHPGCHVAPLVRAILWAWGTAVRVMSPMFASVRVTREEPWCRDACERGFTASSEKSVVMPTAVSRMKLVLSGVWPRTPMFRVITTIMAWTARCACQTAEV